MKIDKEKEIKMQQGIIIKLFIMQIAYDMEEEIQIKYLEYKTDKLKNPYIGSDLKRYI